MSSPEHNSPSMDADGIIRKRVGRACDRCRLKKSKCDGKMPCSRCRADNNICVYGERKKSQDKIYPKGYVEMLEAQQTWLVNGLQSMYHLLDEANKFPGALLEKEENGRPLTHDLLERVGALPVGEHFEEDCEQLLSQASSVRHSSEQTMAAAVIPQTQAIKKPQASHKRRLDLDHSSRARSPDTDRSFSPPSRSASIRSSFETVSPRTPPTPTSADFQEWQMQPPPQQKQQRRSFPGFPETTKSSSMNNNINCWDYSVPQFPNVDMMWSTNAININGAMIPDLSMDVDLDPVTASTNFYDPSLGGQSLVINPVSLSNSIDSADFENFLNSGL